jgi:hypothetical protein
MADVSYALSVKQPWATLLVYGLKTIEIRRWPTQRRGRVLIHAGCVPDSQDWAWQQLPPQLRQAARLVGGIVGTGELTGCIAYRNAATFAADEAKHRNHPTWFQPPVLYGFTFQNVAPLEFRRYPGWVRFFRIEHETAANVPPGPQEE